MKKGIEQLAGMETSSEVKMIKGKVIGVGVGPGDPELMTLKAVKMINEAEIIAVPGKNAEESAAYRIAIQAVPAMISKNVIAIDMPMVLDKDIVKKAARLNADIIEDYLDKGFNVVCLTLGDPTIYSTFTYLQSFFEEDGYDTEIVSGVPSFCAGASRLNIPVAEWDEHLHIIPASHMDDFSMDATGNYVFMKSGKKLGQIRQAAMGAGHKVYAVENCGMADERVFIDESADDMPDKAGYFTIIYTKKIK